MNFDWSISVILVCFIGCLAGMARLGLLTSIAGRPALLVMLALGTGIVYRLLSFPVIDPALIGAGADMGLAALVFAAAMQFRLSKLRQQSPAALRLAVIAGPLFLFATAATAYVLVPALTVWPSILMAGALMLNGAAIDKKTIMASSLSSPIKQSVGLESAVALALGLPLVLFIEAVAVAPYTMGSQLLDASVFRMAIGFAFGGAVALTGAWLTARMITKAHHGLWPAMLAGAVAYLGAPFFGGEPIIAAAAAGFIWSEEIPMKRQTRVRLRRYIDMAVMPVAYAGFGFLVGHRVLEADTLVLLFSVSAITLLRVIPRLIALKKLELREEEQSFLAWFGGAPGAASALYLLSLIDSAAVIDQEALLTIGTTTILLGILATRLSSRPLARYFIRHAAIARKRRYYSTP